MQEVAFGREHNKFVRLREPVKVHTVSILSMETDSKDNRNHRLIHTQDVRHHKQPKLLRQFYESLEPKDRHLSLY